MIPLGPFTFDPAAGRLTCDGQPIPLGGRALAVLTALAGTEGTVTKDDLLAAAWPGVTVEEGNLTVQVAGLRKLLGEDAILTVPRVGYRLRRDAVLPRHAGLPRIAILPFGVPDPGEDRYFADGLVQDIAASLNRFRTFVVVLRQPSGHAPADPPDAAAYLVDGSLRRAPGRLRVSVRLTDTATGSQLWARNFDAADADSFDLQDRIADAVAGALGAEIHSAEMQSALRRPSSGDAYDMFLRALAWAQRNDEALNRQAIATIRRALEIEPDNGRYYAYLSWFFMGRHVFGWPEIDGSNPERSREAAHRALEIGVTDARALSYCAIALMHTGGDPHHVVAVGRRALHENPNNFFVVCEASVIELHCGSLERADELSMRALELSPADPMRFVPLCALAHSALVAGRPEDAPRRAAESRAISTGYQPALWILGAANATLGRTAEAHEIVSDLLALNPRASIAAIRAAQPSLNPGRIEPVLAGLARAGLPET